MSNREKTQAFIISYIGKLAGQTNVELYNNKFSIDTKDPEVILKNKITIFNMLVMAFCVDIDDAKNSYERHLIYRPNQYADKLENDFHRIINYSIDRHLYVHEYNTIDEGFTLFWTKVDQCIYSLKHTNELNGLKNFRANA